MAARDQHGIEAPWGDFQVVGRANRKVDGLAKATGEAVYTDDIALPGMLHAKTLRSPHAHALIKRIDASKALALPGVHAVITGADLPTQYGVIPWTPDETALAVDKVRFVGDEVAAVAAVDEDTANEALELIEAESGVLLAILAPEGALAVAVSAYPKGPQGLACRLDNSGHACIYFSNAYTLPHIHPLALRLRTGSLCTIHSANRSVRTRSRRQHRADQRSANAGMDAGNAACAFHLLLRSAEPSGRLLRTGSQRRLFRACGRHDRKRVLNVRPELGPRSGWALARC